ncbi:MAG: hypothetical protein KK482_22650 [Sinorhizobium meliloti]|jgi:hypothetical protein|uniref:hypothetical protein n=1 Tax=Rhizobium meliloti TaxID=382 RepID=UPI002D7738A3|nr:hypothetical protein [Sinorhizobium meliloti]MCG5486478.1 hypothetical protein [Sinorhizobium meliloti]WRQ70429.1 hypothetical protein SO078_18325 [Sinorhizobium meliloti]
MQTALFIAIPALPLGAALVLLWFGPLWRQQASPWNRSSTWCPGSTILDRQAPWRSLDRI